MKKILFIPLLVLLLHACQKENLETQSDAAITPRSQSEIPSELDDECLYMNDLDNYSILQNHVAELAYESSPLCAHGTDVIPLFDFGLMINDQVNMTPYIFEGDDLLGGLLLRRGENKSYAS